MVRHAQFWGAFWNRSYIHVRGAAPEDVEDGYLVSRQYTLQRYIEACSSRGRFPMKFNGGLFTAGEPDSQADYRKWGGGYWWQNTRLPYWGMLPSGDFELMRPLFNMYQRMLPLAKARTAAYYNHSGAFFPEITNIYGTFANGGWGYGCPKNRHPQWPVHQIENIHTRYEFQGGLELVLMMLDTYAFTQSKDFLRDHLLPMARPVLEFYAQHFPRRDPEGRMVITPSQALETWLCVQLSDCTTNPLPEIAALRVIIPALLTIPEGVAEQDANAWRALLSLVPTVPLKGGALAVAAKHPKQSQNQENVDLYATHPYRLVTSTEPASRDLLQQALKSYEARPFPCNRGWCQDVMAAALLGKTHAAVQQVLQRARTSPPKGWRFVGFMPAFHDWYPNMEHLAVMKIALQFMCMQYHLHTRRIHLLPAWPCSKWDVDFKLHAPLETVIELKLRKGRVTALHVEPPHRRADVTVVGCV